MGFEVYHTKSEVLAGAFQSNPGGFGGFYCGRVG